MASQAYSQPGVQRPDPARLADEWANVGLCGGMFRPVNRLAARPQPRPAGRPSRESEASGPRNQRCCQ